MRMDKNLQLFEVIRRAAWGSRLSFVPFKSQGVKMGRIRPYQSIPWVLWLSVLLSYAPYGQAQDNARKVLRKAPVPYPTILKARGIGGVVRLKVFVKPDGTVRDTEVLGGNPILAESAQKSVMQWKFTTGSSETALEISVVFDPHADPGS
jgi:TonB family protein